MPLRLSHFTRHWTLLWVSQRKKSLVSHAKLLRKKELLGATLLSWSLLGSKPVIKNEDVAGFISQTITPLDKLNQESDSMKTQFELFVMKIQSQVVKALEEIEAKELGKVQQEDEAETEEKTGKFQVDRWTREQGGGGITCVLQDGVVFEKAGVNISVVQGNLPLEAAQQMRSRGKNLPDNVPLKFFAAGVSSVIHPRNPNVPTLHFNYRYFEVDDGDGREKQWWFGGGTDLTPYFLDEDDVRHFHKTLKVACDKHDKTYYSTFKKWCDAYFFIKHRNECRGVGGLFFDDLDKPNQKEAFNFVKSCANSVLPSYLPIVNKNLNKGYSYADRQWQLIRRGRYVEFNLIYDRGTKFGLLTPGARSESILMSLPLVAKWQYRHEVASGSREDRLLQVLRQPVDWV